MAGGVTIAFKSASGAIVEVGAGTPLPASIVGTVAITGPVTATPATGTPFSVVTNGTAQMPTAVKASAATLFELTASNPTASACYLKLYNKATAPAVATDVPLAIYVIPAGGTFSPALGELGKRFAAGFALAITTAMPVGSSDTGIPLAGVLVSGTYL